MQLTNILRDVQEDAQMGRVYFPQDEMAAFGVSEEQLFQGKPDENFRAFMQFHVARAHKYYLEAEKGLLFISPDARVALRLCLVYYREILEEIEKKDYDVFSSRVFVSEDRKMELLQQEMLASPPSRTLSLK